MKKEKKKLDAWKKIIAIVGIATQTIGYFANSKILLVVGLISSIIGIIIICGVK